MLKLAEDWRGVLRHAWSMRFAVLAAVLGGVSATFSIDPFILPLPLGLAAVIAGLTSAAAGLAGIAAAISRIVQQKDLSGERAVASRELLGEQPPANDRRDSRPPGDIS